nr:MAG TPA: hypothetical protein [Bacteriophage sp.]
MIQVLRFAHGTSPYISYGNRLYLNPQLNLLGQPSFTSTITHL